MFYQPVERLDFRAFMRGETVIINQKEIASYKRKKLIYKTAIKVGAITLVILTSAPFPPSLAYAAGEAVATAAKTGSSWDGLINGLLGILDPAAKIFGMIAGLAIMTGNGKIGLERLFWLSIGYITARKVEVWIEFLNTI